MRPRIAITPRRARNSGRGFSLVELIVTIVILSIIAAVAVARSSNTYQSRQRAAASVIASDLRYIRQQAVATGRQTWAKITPASELIEYFQNPAGASSTTGTATAITDPATGRDMSIALNTSSALLNSVGVELGTFDGATTVAWLGFDFRGRPTDSTPTPRTTDAVLSVTASQGSTTFAAITLTVTATTGDVNVTMP